MRRYKEVEEIEDAKGSAIHCVQNKREPALQNGADEN
jgi:hypothetical protein